MASKNNPRVPSAQVGSALVKFGVAAGIAVYAAANSLYNVEGGHRAIVFNRITGIKNRTFPEGTHFIFPWFEVPIIYDVRARPHLVESTSGSRDLQMVKIGLRVLTRPVAEELPTIFRSLGTNYNERVLPNIIHETLKAVVARYNASQLITQREAVSREIRSIMTERAKHFNIALDDVSITSLTFGKEFTAAIEAKQVAAQEAERAKFIVEKAEQDKRSAIIRAEGEAKSAQLIGQAIANQIIVRQPPPVRGWSSPFASPTFSAVIINLESTMSSSSNKSRNFRRRPDHDEPNPDDAAAAVAPSPDPSRKPAPPAPSSASGSSKPKKLLSFADDEGEDDDSAAVTPLNLSSRPSGRRKPPSSSASSSSRLGKPSSSSHKLTASKDRVPLSSPATTSNVLPQAGTYTKEALLELQKNTRTLAKPSSKPSPASASSEPKIVLKGLLKPAPPSPHQTLGDRHVSDHLISNNADDDDDPFEDRLASMGLGKSKSGIIPDEERIRKIKAEREKKRHSSSSAPDFIPLNGTTNDAQGSSDDDDELELRTRVALVGRKDGNTHGVFEDVDHLPPSAAVSARYTNVVEDVANDGGDDDEEAYKIWEREQLGKALGKRMDDASAVATNRAVAGGVSSHNTATMMMPPPLPQQQQQQQQHRVSSVYPNIGGGFMASQGLDNLTIPQQAKVASKALQDNFRRIKESHDRTVSALERTDDNLTSSLDNITALEGSLSVAGEKFIFMQRLRDFVSVLCDFLQDKAAYIEELEERMQKVQEERAAAILERRIADDHDEMVGVDAAVKAAMIVFKERGHSALMISAAAGAAQTASAALKVQEKATLPELDELGRDMSMYKRMEMKRRAEARQRRRAKFDSKRILSSMEVDDSSAERKIEGESSTEESESESEAYRSSRDRCLEPVDQILSDASEEFSQLSVVKERLEKWKQEYAGSYRDAYMSLSVPAIFSPYVRLELLHWDPLRKSDDFFDMNWHSQLFNYGIPEGASDLNSEDSDSNLIPQLVEKIAVPKLHHQIVHCWDTLSTLETGNAVAATSMVINYVPASSQALSELLVAVRTRLADTASNIVVPNWSSLVLKAVPSASRIAVYRFGVSVRLMRNICLWKDILAMPVLEELALDELLRRKVLPHVQSISSDVHDAIARTERIVASLSGVWTGPNVTGDRSGKLQVLVDFVVSLGRTLEKKQAALGVSEGETSGLARRLKKMLVELNDYDNAQRIAKAFRLREAL